MELTVKQPIGLACDHAGYEMKEFVKEYLVKKEIAYIDFGTYSTESVDYPDFAHPLALAVENEECGCGFAICGSGNGIAMTLNKHQGIRAAICWEGEIAMLARLHNDANICVLPGRFIDKSNAKEIVEAYLTTPFEGGRHQLRINKIAVK